MVRKKTTNSIWWIPRRVWFNLRLGFHQVTHLVVRLMDRWVTSPQLHLLHYDAPKAWDNSELKDSNRI